MTLVQAALQLNKQMYPKPSKTFQITLLWACVRSQVNTVNGPVGSYHATIKTQLN